MLEPWANVPWFGGWTVTCKDGSASGTRLLEALDRILPLLIQRTRLRGCHSRVSTKPAASALSLWAAWRMFSNPARWPPLLQSMSPPNCAEMHHEAPRGALPGDDVGFSVKKVPAKDVRRGTVAADNKNGPPMEAAGFVAQIVILNHPGQVSADGHTAHLLQTAKLQEKTDRHSGKKLKDGPRFLKSGDATIVAMVPGKPMRVLRASLTVLCAVLLSVT